uniref:Uncharacterized protein n=1 Tax=Opuntia streptacantha TaxID=393608 RepID=A0A7C9CII2_OPUST
MFLEAAFSHSGPILQRQGSGFKAMCNPMLLMSTFDTFQLEMRLSPLMQKLVLSFLRCKISLVPFNQPTWLARSRSQRPLRWTSSLTPTHHRMLFLLVQQHNI